MQMVPDQQVAILTVRLVVGKVAGRGLNSDLCRDQVWHHRRESLYVWSFQASKSLSFQTVVGPAKLPSTFWGKLEIHRFRLPAFHHQQGHGFSTAFVLDLSNFDPLWQSFTWLQVNTCIFEGDIWRFTLGIPWVLTHSQWGIYQRPHRLRNWWDRSGSAATRTRAEGLKSSNGHGISWGYDLMFHRLGIFGICEKPYCHRLCCFCAKQCRIHWAVTFLNNKKRDFLQTLRAGVRRKCGNLHTSWVD